jgi:hypothetical protein
MKYDDLIKKLERLETPEIEMTGHKHALKMALLRSGRFKAGTIRDWVKILAPVTTAVVLIAVVGFFNVIQPRLQMAQAKEIVVCDPQVHELMMENGLDITEVRLQNGEGYVLLDCQAASWESHRDEYTSPAAGEESLSAFNVTVSGYILKVDLGEDKVTEFGQVDDIKGLRYVNLEGMNLTEFKPLEGEEHPPSAQ